MPGETTSEDTDMRAAAAPHRPVARFTVGTLAMNTRQGVSEDGRRVQTPTASQRAKMSSTRRLAPGTLAAGCRLAGHVRTCIRARARRNVRHDSPCC